MTDRQLVDYDPLTKVSVWHQYDELTDETTIYSEQDVSAILNVNKFLQNQGDGFKGERHEFWHAASIPLLVIEQWRKEGIDVFNKNDWPEVRKRLNSSDYAYLRVGQFTI